MSHESILDALTQTRDVDQEERQGLPFSAIVMIAIILCFVIPALILMI